jgi:phosphoglycolate phosphatase-like HAD superfamily hydrolase
MRPTISVVITDLDNTLFDWVEVWYRSFSAMLEVLVSRSGIPRDQLIEEIRQVHQRRGTSEYAFLIEEIPSLRAAFPGKNLVDEFDDAIHAYRSARKEALKPYPAVLDTLRTLKARGVLIVGYTESMAFYTNYRMRHLAFDGAIDFLYSPPDHDLPQNLTPEQVRKYPAQYYDLNFTEHRYTPRGEVKPNPEILSNIISDVGAARDQCLYVGDSLMKDVAMAQAAHVHDAYALYGKAQDRAEYELLRLVTHWTPEQVQREKDLLKSGSVLPSHTLEVSFSEVLAKFDFKAFASNPSRDQRLDLMVDIWKKIVDVQQHFNDIEMKIRSAAITVIAALMGAAGYAEKDHVSLALFAWHVPLSVFIIFTALVVWAAFWFMDRHWYHRLLYGAVKQGQLLEDKLKPVLPEIQLTKTIGKESPLKVFGFVVHSTHKMGIFYGVVGVVMIAIGAVLLIGT